MTDGPSLFSLVAGFAYLLVVGACLAAQNAARNSSRPRGERLAWLLIAVLFVLLAVSRWLNIEARLHDFVREAMRSDGLYDGRREVQAPLAAAAVVAVAGLVWLLASSRPHKGEDRLVRRSNLARIGAAAMIGLVGLRLISFHNLDAILYRLRLNWFADMGATALVAVCAVSYVAVARSGAIAGSSPRTRSGAGRSRARQ